MTMLGPKSSPGDQGLTWDSYQKHVTSLAKLEEYRKQHDKVHEEHVATKAWVYRTVLTIVASLGGIVYGIVRLVAHLSG